MSVESVQGWVLWSGTGPLPLTHHGTTLASYVFIQQQDSRGLRTTVEGGGWSCLIATPLHLNQSSIWGKAGRLRENDAVGVHLGFPFDGLVEEGSTKEDVFHTTWAHGGVRSFSDISLSGKSGENS
ncbi:hypothetical protein CJF31_00003298 [Rutstroemia sp. NJR-2017a BVV2]|nr:hypothetical protein CJF31_00002090 [Rutstroemia sp. NJR-2017a BVV2]PQE18629.1 hypothetical protein CJF31_00003298 [Rutstroemia sp. NJR-2017a BVV2]